MNRAGASPWLSVIVPVLDEAAGLAPLLAGLASLRASGAEVIVVDGGSTDGTWATLLARACGDDPGFDQLLTSARGRALQMNRGAERARGTLLLFLHADTRLPDDALARLRTVHDDGTPWGRFDVAIDGDAAMLRVVAWMMNRRSRLTGIATGDQAIFVRRALFEALGGYAPQPLMEDIVLSARLRRVAPPCCLDSRVHTAGRRWLAHGVWRTIVRMWWLRLRFALGASAATLAHAYGYRPASAPPTPQPVALALLTRVPQPGHTKTRLIPALGAHGAARLQRALLLRQLRAVADAGFVRCTVHVAGTGRMVGALQRRGWSTRPQVAGDLGARMAAAVHHAAPLPVIVTGCDCPGLDADRLSEAADVLRAGADAVVVPAEDGGYVLIGLAAGVPPTVFDGVDWGSADVMAQTAARLDAAGLDWRRLAPLWDVDRPDDLPRLAEAVPALAPRCTLATVARPTTEGVGTGTALAAG